MKKIIPVILSGFMLLGCNQSKLKYPETFKEDVTDTYFGTQVPDPYRWLEDDKSERVADWVKEQNEVTFGYLNSIPFRGGIKNRLNELFDYSSVSAPFMEGGKIFSFRREGMQDQWVLYFQNSPDDEPKVLIDPNKFSDDGTVALSNVAVSRDGKYIAYAVADGGSDWNKIKVRLIDSGKDLTDEVKWVKFSSIQWFKNGFF
ncbi:MAG TPA: S9 family peptidase, partial [Bacteroidales bacterium]|nr:S9 family peptidase [Bacteroidales bacterium]